MKNKYTVFAVLGAAVLALSACGSKGSAQTTTAAPTEAQTEAAAEAADPSTFLGEAGLEDNGSFSSLSDAETGWEEDRENVLDSYKSSGKKAPGDNFVRAKAESVIKLVNAERSKAGLGSLSLDESLMAAAETRAKEQKASFSHTRPDGSNCFTVFSQYNIPANYRGENLACGGPCSAEQITNAWMNSPGHKENIMNGKFSRIGVGCFESGGYGYWAQEFAN